MKIIKYDTQKYCFGKLVKDLYQIDDLSKAHLLLREENKVGEVGHDTHTALHTQFYGKLNSGWNEMKDLYREFVREVVCEVFGSDQFIFQTFPSYRIQYPENKAVTTWHYDSDALHMHPEGEINFLFPLTSAFDTNTVWMESVPGLGDFNPVELSHGECLIFNGNKCRHGNKVNKTGVTRISLDFRILPLDRYDPNYSAVTATKKNRFVVGEYYSSLETR